MNLNIKATKTTLTEAVRHAIEDKLSRLEKFLRPEDKVHVEFSVDTHHKKGQVFSIDIQAGKLYAKSSGSTFLEALDLVVKKIKDQVLKAKDKKLDSRK